MDLFILFQEACNIWWNRFNLLCPDCQLKFWKKKKNISGLTNENISDDFFRILFLVLIFFSFTSFKLDAWMIYSWHVILIWRYFFPFGFRTFSFPYKFINAGLYSLVFMLTVHIVTNPVCLITVHIAVIKMVINHVKFNIRHTM